MQIETTVGPQIGQDGANPKLRGTRDSLGSQDTHARYQEAVYRGNVYIGSNPLGAPVTTQAGLSATTPALTLWNPLGSGKIGVLWFFGYGVNAAPAAASVIALAANVTAAQAAPSSTTLATVTNARLDLSATPVLQCYRIATLPAAPITLFPVAFIDAASNVSYGQVMAEIAGMVQVGPGMILSVQATTAISLLNTFVWEEIPV